MTRPRTTGKAIGKFGFILTAVVALITDLLAPLGPFAGYLALAVVPVIAVIAAARLLPPVDRFGRSLFKGYWQVPVLGALTASFLVLAATHVITRSAPQGGWVGSRVERVRDAQVGIFDEEVREIADTTHGIKEDTEEISTKLGDVAEDTDEILSKLDQVKKETSDDPRKELANLGVSWSTQSFVDALIASDARTVKLFLQGGMAPTIRHANASAVLYVLQAKLPDPVPMLELLIDAGLDVNAHLYDGRILRHYSDQLPPSWDAAELPSGYDWTVGSFGGPMLLWLAIRSAFGYPIEEQWDDHAIGFLKDRGADTRLTRAFLEAMESAWGEYPAYQRVRAAVG
jgi:hypothetical protein